MVNKIIRENKMIALGILGSIIILYGYSKNHPQIYYIVGSLVLLITALHYKLVYFIALEIILVAGHLAILLGIGTYTQIALPLLLCFQLIIFYLMMGRNNTIFLLIGVIGIALLSLGFSYNNQWVFFSGSSFISIYAYYDGFKGVRPSFLWAILNTIFAAMALFNILLK